MLSKLIFNWKMNGFQGQRDQIMSCLLSLSIKQTITICVPFVYLSEIAEQIANQPMIQLGAQDVSDQVSGAYTGEVSAKMLKELDVKVCLVGHSERQRFGESDQMIADKAAQCITCGIVPVICLAGCQQIASIEEEFEVIERRLKVLCQDDRLVGQWMVAYEPVWAIGTGKSASLNHIVKIHDMIGVYLQGSQCSSVPRLYGGSLNIGNINDILALQNVDGGLVGGAGLDTIFLETALQ